MMITSYEAPSIVNYEINLATSFGFVAESDIWSLSNISYAILPIFTEELTRMEISFLLERKITYYVVSVFLPLELLMILQFGAFFVPPNDSNRCSYSVTVNLAFAVYQQVIQESMPQTSQFVYLIFYISAYMAVGGTISLHCLMVTAAPESWHEDGFGGKKQKRWITKSRLIDISSAILLIIIVVIVNIVFAIGIQ